MREKLQTTVVMATYNGEKNIIEQLNSLKNQSQNSLKKISYRLPGN